MLSLLWFECITYLRILNHLKSNLPSLKGRRAPCMRMASTRGGAKAQKSSMLHILVTMRNLLSASCDDTREAFINSSGNQVMHTPDEKVLLQMLACSKFK